LFVSEPANSLPDYIETLKAMVLAERSARLAVEAEAKARSLLIEKLKFTIAKLRHEKFGAEDRLRWMANADNKTCRHPYPRSRQANSNRIFARHPRTLATR